jgi:phage terminase large subunit-like protein
MTELSVPTPSQAVDPAEYKRVTEAYWMRCATDIAFFAREFLPHLLTSSVPKFHLEMYQLLSKEQRLVMAAPRGFAKSTLSTVIYPIWLAACGSRKKDICVVSASEGLAIEMMRRVKRELEGNKKLQQWFNNGHNFRTEKWSESHFITKSGVQFRAKGAQGQIRGFRPDCLILDDIETDESVESEEQMKKLKEWLFKACLNTLMPNGQFIIIGSIIHPLSVLSDLLLVDNGWTKRKYQAYHKAEQVAGKELWPELWNHERLQARKREIGSFAFSSEYLHDPISDETAPIKPNQIRYWKELPEQISLVIAVDPAYSEDDKADYKVAALVGVDQQGNHYLVSYIRTHAGCGEFFNAIINLWIYNRGKVTAIGVPNSGTEKQFFKAFVDHCNNKKCYPPIVELKNSFITQTGSSVRQKKSRIIASLQPLFEAGKYYINASHSEALDELLTIGSSRWDDVVDAMCYAEQILTPVFEDMSQSQDFDYRPRQTIPTNYGYSI